MTPAKHSERIPELLRQLRVHSGSEGEPSEHLLQVALLRLQQGTCNLAAVDTAFIGVLRVCFEFVGGEVRDGRRLTQDVVLAVSVETSSLVSDLLGTALHRRTDAASSATLLELALGLAGAHYLILSGGYEEFAGDVHSEAGARGLHVMAAAAARAAALAGESE